MIKKFLLYLWVIVLVSCGINSNCFASSIDTATITTLDDESYYVITIKEIPTFQKSSTKTGEKTISYYNKNDELLWSVSVKGTFSYTGSSATCTASSVSTTCPASNWKISSKSSSKSGAKASATATAKRYASGVTVQTVTKTVTLTCSATGTLS